MKKPTTRGEKWLSAALGALCLLLFAHLLIPRGATVRASRGARPSGARNSSSALADDLSRYDPDVKLDTLIEIQRRPLPEFGRDPFEFPVSRTPAPQGHAQPVATQPATPPPPPFKALGYAEKKGGVREALVSDDEQIYVVHEGETFAKNYRVITISNAMVEIEDETAHARIQLPIAP